MMMDCRVIQLIHKGSGLIFLCFSPTNLHPTPNSPHHDQDMLSDSRLVLEVEFHTLLMKGALDMVFLEERYRFLLPDP